MLRGCCFISLLMLLRPLRAKLVVGLEFHPTTLRTKFDGAQRLVEVLAKWVAAHNRQGLAVSHQ